MYYAECGYCVIPVAQGTKRPFFSNWTEIATKDAEVIKLWWEQNPFSNVGILTGKRSGIVVVDVDKKSNGVENYERYRRYFPPTLKVKTPNGGFHLYYKYPPYVEYIKSISGVLPGIDSKADGGQVLAPPSTIITEKGMGHYEVEENVPLAECPSFWLDKVSSRKRRTSREGGEIGTRNSTLTSVAGKLRQEGYGYEEIATTLLEKNGSFQNPLEEEEVCNIARSVSRYDVNIFSFALNEVGHAERVLSQCRDKLKYCREIGEWVGWDGRKWGIDFKGSNARNKTTYTLKEYYRISKLKHDEKKEKIYKKHMDSAHDHLKKTPLNNIVSLMSDKNYIRLENLDADPYLLNLMNGIYDLKRDRFMNHDKKYYLTKMAPVSYDKNATCPRWNQFIDEITLGDKELAKFLQTSIGLSLSGDATEEKVWVAYGTGGNGKSKFLEIIQDLLGDYAQQAPSALLIQKKFEGGASPEKARIRGVRFLSCNEIGEGKIWDDEFLKSLTGRDRITARFLRNDFFEFKPICKVWQATNNKPRASPGDYGLWRRILLVPFEAKFETPDTTLSDKLQKELSGILNWAIEGFRKWKKSGLQVPNIVQEATESYKEEMDYIGSFLADACEAEEGALEPVADMYQAYVYWCQECGFKPKNIKMFGRMLSERGIKQKRSTSRFWVGFRVKFHYKSKGL